MYFFWFYPLGLDRERRRRPWLTWAMAAVMSVAYAWIGHAPDLLAADPWDLVFFPGDGPFWAVTTAVFMHAGWLHLLGNLAYLLVFGPPLEDRLGPWRFGLYFLLLGNFGNLAHGLVAVLDLLGQGGLGVMGASGAIAGLLGFALVRFTDARVEVAWWVFAPLMGQNRAGKSRVPLVLAILVWVGLQVIHASLATETGSSVSFGAHLGGFTAGVLLALALGELGAGRAEAARERARRYFAEGHYHAAVGAWSEYLERVPQDDEARLESARALRLCGRGAEATAIFAAAYRRYRKQGLVHAALEVHAEAARGNLDLELDADELAQVAFYKEKQLDYRGALDAYLHLYRTHPRHPQGQRALVRVVVLCAGKVEDPEQKQRWLEEAARSLPPGSWRTYLEREFNLPAAPGAVPTPGRV